MGLYTIMLCVDIIKHGLGFIWTPMTSQGLKDNQKNQRRAQKLSGLFRLKPEWKCLLGLANMCPNLFLYNYK